MSEKKYGSSLTLDERVKLFNEWLEDGGIKTIWSKDLLEDLMKVKADANGNVIPETVSPLVNAAMLAYEGSQSTFPLLIDIYFTIVASVIRCFYFYSPVKSSF